jgi:uncharacterized protein YjbI with pentapeptide repeats
MNSDVSTLSSPVSATAYSSWHEHWLARQQPWRTEPEIAPSRQAELRRCLEIVPDIEQGRYPFRALAQKLTRADVEWLLANALDCHHTSDGQQPAVGLDLRGADLSKADLRGLPLLNMLGGLDEATWNAASPAQREMAAIHLEYADLRAAHLEGALLRGAHLEGADLREVHLEGADLRHAHLEGKGQALKSLPPADLRRAYCDQATRLEGVQPGDTQYGSARIVDVSWGNANVAAIDWRSIVMLGDEFDAHQWKDLDSYQAALRANRQIARLLRAQGCYEDAAYFSYRAHINARIIARRQMLLPLLLRLVQQPQMPLPLLFRRLEQWWHSRRWPQPFTFAFFIRGVLLLLMLLACAIWAPVLFVAIVVLSVATPLLVYALLRRRSRLLHQYQPPQQFFLPANLQPQRHRFRCKLNLMLSFLLCRPPASLSQPLRGGRWVIPLLALLMLDNTLVCGGRYLFSLLLDSLTGYGHRPARILIWYLATVAIFALLYGTFGHLTPVPALVLSIISFHGHGFFPSGNAQLGSPLLILPVLEAVLGLVIEISLLAALLRFRRQG